MAGVSVEKVKEFISSQIQDEDKWAFNMRMLRSIGLFAGSIFLMRNFGDLMAI
ncbi:unnamed protein product [Victoria cruziana]